MKAEIAVIGGSGMYSMAALKNAKTTSVSTPYGVSPEILVGSLIDHRVAFLPRHGKGHKIPPHLVNYRANMWALKKMGVKRILTTTASGSINPKMRIGELAILTQFLDFTKCRQQTFYEGGKSGVAHVDASEPYCPELRGALLKNAKKLKMEVHPKATYACTEGPRFETSAEIKAYGKLGADLVGMTNVPECVLARELEMCYAAVGIVTNFGAGISKTKLSHAYVLELMNENMKMVQGLILETIPTIPEKISCDCCRALEGTKL
ncbi:MAG: S-methyl-5'-thioadenosine phosphorylase [Methanobacteriota archaeon]